MRRLLLAGLLGGLAAFIWGFVSWVVLPWHNMTMDTLPDADIFRAEFKEKIPESGVYLFPGMPPENTPEVKKEFDEKYAEGPSGQLFLLREGVKNEDPMIFVRGYLIAAISSLIGAGLLSWSAPVLKRYGQRVAFVTLVGSGAVFSVTLINWNYWQLPAGFTFVNAVDLLIFWFVIGLVTAALIRPSTASEVHGN